MMPSQDRNMHKTDREKIDMKVEGRVSLNMYANTTLHWVAPSAALDLDETHSLETK